MKYRNFGNTTLSVSEIGFGAWAIGGPVMAGDIPIGWGEADDAVSIEALRKALDVGINFFDTADFYGLGHSETLIGQEMGKRKDLVIATKVGHRLSENQDIILDYTKNYMLQACEQSLRRLRRDCIDFYQLHTAKVADLENGECMEAMQQLVKEGKIRYWGLSLNTFYPDTEADWLMDRHLGDGFQVVLNIINQRGLSAIQKAGKYGKGIIVRMPLQFGLLTGKFDENTRFPMNDHRFFRLPPELLVEVLEALEPVWQLSEKYGISATAFAMSYILSQPEVSTVIPGIRTPAQAEDNVNGIVPLCPEDLELLHNLFTEKFDVIVGKMK